MEEYLLILKFIGMLVLVALLAYFIIRFGLRRLQPPAGRGHVRVIQRVPLDMKGDRLLVLVSIGKRILLLGSAQGSISLLSDYSAEELPPPAEDPVQPEAGSFFSRLLADYRNRARSGKEGTGY